MPSESLNGDFTSPGPTSTRAPSTSDGSEWPVTASTYATENHCCGIRSAHWFPAITCRLAGSTSLLAISFHLVLLCSKPTERTPDEGEQREDDTSYAPRRGGARESRYMDPTGYRENDDSDVEECRKWLVHMHLTQLLAQWARVRPAHGARQMCPARRGGVRRSTANRQGQNRRPYAGYHAC